MNWRRVVLGLHVACVLLAYSFVGLAYLCLPATTARGPEQHRAALAVGVCAASGFLTGLALMAGRSRQSESLALAFSTIAAFLLLLLIW